MTTTKEQMKPLNTTDGWEDLVNSNCAQRRAANERLAARNRVRRLKKLWIKACSMATIALTFVILGATGGVAGWLATVLSIGATMTGCFLVGRYMELKKA